MMFANGTLLGSVHGSLIALSALSWVCTLFVVYSSHSSNIYRALKNVYKYFCLVFGVLQVAALKA